MWFFPLRAVSCLFQWIIIRETGWICTTYSFLFFRSRFFNDIVTYIIFSLSHHIYNLKDSHKGYFSDFALKVALQQSEAYKLLLIIWYFLKNNIEMWHRDLCKNIGDLTRKSASVTVTLQGTWAQDHSVLEDSFQWEVESELATP